MEVPHGIHHSSHSKSWRSYAGEFLMLFLAVFCAFIAENLREHFTEREWEHQYAGSLVVDWTKDTTKMNAIISANKKLYKKIDTLLGYLKTGVPDSSVSKVYKYAKFTGVYLLFTNANGTMTQLKNAGGLRLIHDTGTVKAIADYDEGLEQLSEQGQAYQRSCLGMLDFMTQTMDLSTSGDPAGKKLYLDRSPDKIRQFYNKKFHPAATHTGVSGYAAGTKR